MTNTSPLLFRLITLLSLLGLASALGCGSSQPSGVHTESSQSAQAAPRPYDDAAADAQCNACTASGGNWFPLERRCYSSAELHTAPMDVIDFGDCPGPCAPGNCAGCVQERTCEAAGCTFQLATEVAFCE